MPLTQGGILIGFRAADEKVTLLVLLGVLSTSNLVSFTAVKPLLQVGCYTLLRNSLTFKYQLIIWHLVPLSTLILV